MTDFPELDTLASLGDERRAASDAAFHKVKRRYLGVPLADLDRLVRGWRETLDLDRRLDLSERLWQSDVHDARIAAAKLLTQARIAQDQAVWEQLMRWCDTLDQVVLADYVMKAVEKRLGAHPERVAAIEPWRGAENPLLRRGMIMAHAPLAKLTHPKADEIARRAQLLDWMADLAQDRNGDVQAAIGGWLRDAAKHDPDLVSDWLATYGDRLKPFARKEARRGFSPR